MNLDDTNNKSGSLDFLKNQKIGPHQLMYRSKIYQRNLLVQRDRTLEEFLLETFGTLDRAQWSDNIRDKENVQCLFNIINQRLVPVFSDVVNFGCVSHICMCLRSNVEKEVFSKGKIGNWRDAEKHGVLKSYFGANDKFGFFSGESRDYDYSYSGDYYYCVQNLIPMSIRVQKYRTWMSLNSKDVKVSENSFENCLNFVYNFEKNLGEQLKVFDSLKLKNVNIVGDGAGSGSIASLILGMKYESSEINNIGAEARQLGIITSLEDNNLDREKTLVCSNVVNYLPKGRWELYLRRYKKILVIEEDRFFPGCERFEEVHGSNGKFWILGLENVPIPVPPVAKSKNYLVARAPVNPQDEKSRRYCSDVDTKDYGLKVACKDDEFSLNIQTMNYPGKLERAKPGQVKMRKGCKFKYSHPGQIVSFPGESFKYFPNDIDNPYSFSGDVQRDGDLYKIVVANPSRIKYILYDDMVIRVYYLRTVLFKGIEVSYYRDSVLNVQSDFG